MLHQDTYQKLQPGHYYHIYNRGNNKEVIFKEPGNYFYFLTLWEKYIHPVAATFCYALLPNHFHFFIRVRLERFSQIEPCEMLSEAVVSRSFSNLFNAYAKAFNKRYNRTGSLFQERFRRKEITYDAYFTGIIGYILTNAIKHGYSTTADAYPYAAWKSLLSRQQTNLSRDEVLEWFGGREPFMQYIKDYQQEIKLLKKYLENTKDDDYT